MEVEDRTQDSCLSRGGNIKGRISQAFRQDNDLPCWQPDVFSFDLEIVCGIDL